MVVVVPGSYPPPVTFDAGALADFLDLRTAVIEHVSNPGIADVFPRLVALAESRFNRTLRMREQITNTTLTMTAGRGPLPANFAEMIGIYDGSGAEYLMQSPQHRHGYYYSIQGSEVVAANITGSLAMDYYAMIPPLGSSITTSNWLLARYPDVYLYAVSFEAAKYAHDAELAMAAKGLMDDAIALAKGDDEAARYSRSCVRVAGPTP